MPRYSDHYLAQLLRQRDYSALVDLQGSTVPYLGTEVDNVLEIAEQNAA